MWDFSRTDWWERLKAGKSLLPELPALDKAQADKAVELFNELRLPDVPDMPRLAEAAGEWQRDIVRAIFGSLINGVRHVPEVFVMVPKKMSKTTGGAALTLTAMLRNTRPRAEMIYVGPTQEVADLAFQQTVGMIEADPFLIDRFHVAHHIKTISDRKWKSRLKVKTFDMKVVTGAKPSWVLLDEVHLMSNMKEASRIIGQIRGGMLPNPEAVLLMITTQSDEPPAGAFKAELDYARSVRDGRVSSSRMLPLIWEFPLSMQTSRERPWADPANWPLVMPNLNRPVPLERFVEEFATAKEKGELEERRWASQHLNVEIGIALLANAWPGAEFWGRGEDPGITREALSKRCEVIVAGVDGGGLDDLFGLTLVGRDRETKDWLTWSHAWCHQSVLERRKAIAPRLRDFEQAGELTIVDDELADLSAIVDTIEAIHKAGLLGAVAVDPAGLGEFVEALKLIGITEEKDILVGVPQGYGMMNAIKTAERKLANGTLKHAPSRLMDWCVSNLRIEPTATAIRATKQTAGDAKIDPVMALFDACQVMVKDPKPKTIPTFQLFRIA